jgi:hypothetical protein
MTAAAAAAMHAPFRTAEFRCCLVERRQSCVFPTSGVSTYTAHAIVRRVSN